jgi:cyanuric acid amidohydrolase
VNDFSRTLAAAAWTPLLAPDAVTVFSGGTEGVLSPHVNLLVRDHESSGHDRGLVAAAGHTAPIPPKDLGRVGQIEAVAARVGELIESLGVDADDTHLVLVKCPLLTSATMASMRAEGLEPVTEDTYESMSRSRAASALGIAVALGECTLDDAIAALDGDASIWSSRASASAGAELTDCHILVLAVSRSASNPLRAVHGAMNDAMDIATVTQLLARVAEDGGEVAQIFAKAEADPQGSIRGLRHTMLTDSDLNSTRHARAAVGGLLSALRGSSDIYVSGGAEHQGPAGGGSITILYRVPDVVR